MSYADAVIEWIATAPDMPSVGRLYRVTEFMSPAEMVVTILDGQAARADHQHALANWESDGGA